MSEELGCHNVVIEGENRELEVQTGELEGEKGRLESEGADLEGQNGELARSFYVPSCPAPPGGGEKSVQGAPNEVGWSGYIGKSRKSTNHQTQRNTSKHNINKQITLF